MSAHVNPYHPLFGDWVNQLQISKVVPDLEMVDDDLVIRWHLYKETPDSYAENWRRILWQIMLCRAPAETPALVAGMNELFTQYNRHKGTWMPVSKFWKHLWIAMAFCPEHMHKYSHNGLFCNRSDSPFNLSIRYYYKPPTQEQFYKELAEARSIYEVVHKYKAPPRIISKFNELTNVQDRIDLLLGLTDD